MAGDRFNAGKIPLSFALEMPNGLAGVSAVGAFGAVKYSRNNYKKGLDHVQIVDSLLRHLAQYLNGEDVDPESNLPHVDHVAWNALALAEMVRIYPEGDSRDLPNKEK